MRLWHEDLIHKLPRQQLLGQHRECCALRGNVSEEWLDKNYRGKVCKPHKELKEVKINSPIYKEHDDSYYMECINNLAEKGIEI